MKLRLIIAILLLTGLSYASGLFTATKSGNWNDPTVWGNTAGTPTCHTGASAIPCMTDSGDAGDWVNLVGFVVTCPIGVTCSVGNSPASAYPTTTTCTLATSGVVLVTTAATGGLTNNGTFIYAGHACLAFGTITIGPGAKFQHDNSWQSSGVPTFNYQFADNQSSSRAVWVSNTTAASPFIWEGDSFQSSKHNTTGTCITPLQAACLAGAVVYANSAGYEMGEGSISYGTFQNIIGSTIGGSKGSLASYVLTANNGTFTNITVTNSGYVFLKVSGTSKTLTWNKGYVTNTSDTNSSQGCFQTNSQSGGVLLVSNSLFGCPVALNSSGSVGGTFRNVACHAEEAGAYYSASSGTNLFPCFSQANDASLMDQVFITVDGWNTSTPENTSAKSNINAGFLQNSVAWVPKNMPNIHLHNLNQAWLTGAVPTTAWYQINNVYGAFGDTLTAATEGHQAASPQGGVITIPGVSITISGNIVLCGYQGRGSITAGGIYSSISSTGANVTTDIVSVFQNTYCAAARGLSNSTQTDGAMALEAATFNGNIFNVRANIFFRNDGINQGAVPEIFDTSANANYVTTPPIDYLMNNAIINQDTVQGNNTPCGTFANTCAWVTHMGSSATEIMKPSTPPPFVDPGRSVPLFAEYLNSSGIFPYSAYQTATPIKMNGTTITTNWRGPWLATNSYAVGDVISYSAAGVYGGRTTYWVCREPVAASLAESEPIRGNSATNPYAGPTRYWESAWARMWMDNAVLAGTIYSDGALLPLYNSPVMYAVGLLNAWLRSGFITLDSSLWGGQTSGPMCSTSGTVGIECGAAPLKSIQHIPPFIAVN